MKTKYKIPEFEINFEGKAKNLGEAMELSVSLMKKVIKVTEYGRRTSFRHLEMMLEAGDGEGIVALAALYCEEHYVPLPAVVSRKKKREALENGTYVKRNYKKRTSK